MVQIPLFFLTFLLISAKTVVADDPYIPCKSYIGFYYDDSVTLRKDQFRTQMNFIKNALGDLNYPQRIAAEGGYGGEFNWNSKLSIFQMQSAIDAAEQTSIPYSLLQQFSSLATNFENLNDFDDRFGVLIFISDTSDNALRNADRLFPKLKGIRITFVLLGNNVDSSKLRNFSSNFLYWPDLTQPAPDNWDLVSYHTYGCDAPSPSSSSVKPPTTQFTSTKTTPPPGSYYPCQNWVSVLTDNSNALTYDQFQSQLNFTKSILGQMTHPERLRYGRYDAQSGSIIYDWNFNNDQQGLQAAIDGTTQTNFGTTILKAIQALVAEQNQNLTIPDSNLIFVTDTSNSIQIQQAVNLYNSELKPLGVKLTFILAGANTNANALQGFDDVIIYNWQNIGFFSQPDGWDLSTAFRCTSLSSASMSPPSTRVTPVAGPYVPCQVLVTTIVDISDTLNIDYFQKQLTFTKAILSQINHPERIRYGAYLQTIGNMTYLWNDTNTQEGLQKAIDDTKQTSQPSSLSGAMRVLMSNPDTNRTVPDSTIIFVTDTTNSVQIQQAVNLYNSALKGRVQITFILAGNKTDAAALQGFDDAIFFNWKNMNTSQPDNWDISQALRCTPFTTPSSYIPCQSWISFGIDDSNNLNSNDFNTQLNFISNAIGSLNHPERIQAIGAFDQPVVWNSPYSIDQIQAAVMATDQEGPYSLRLQFAALLNSLQTTQINNIPIGALIFISDTSDQVLQGASNIFSQIQNVSITFVLLGNNVDQNKLTQFSNNFILWTDLSKPQPDNWNDDVAATAYGCKTSTASPITMSSQSSVSPTRGGITIQTEPTRVIFRSHNQIVGLNCIGCQ